MKMRLSRALPALVLFGATFGYVEAAVVVYLRTLQEPLREELLADVDRDELFPLLTLEQLRSADLPLEDVLYTELGRELATLLMLAAVALAMARNFQHWLAAFMIAFGIWDIFYYVWLRVLIGWPASLATWDILFLLPVPWVAPVIAPVLVAISMIVAGVAVLWRQSRERPIDFAWFHWALVFGGGLIIVVAFCWDFRNAVEGGWPHPFNWPLFVTGELVGLAGFAHAYRRERAL
jgi:hypothetical protein